MQKEGAVTERHFGSAAKTIEAERARSAAGQAGAGRGPEAAAKGASATRTAFTQSFSDPAHEQEKVQELYRKVLEARAANGEKSNAPSLKDFERFVRQKTKELQAKGGLQVEYSVSIEGGRVKLKARISD
jgi:arginyl-tRNA--protein-N-Asp/Glu arginylyltransferase